MKYLDNYKLFLVGYPLLASICLRFVGFRATKDACLAREYTRSERGLKTSLLIAAGLPLQLGLNLMGDAYQLGVIGKDRVMRELGYKVVDKGNYSGIYDYNTPFCLKQSIYDMTRLTLTHKDMANLKARIEMFLAGYPPENVPEWSTVEEGFALAKKLSREPNPMKQSNERINERFSQVKRNLATLLSQSERLLSSVYRKDDFLNRFAKAEQEQAKVKQDVVPEIPNYPFEKLLEIVDVYISKALENAGRFLNIGRTYRPIAPALKLLKNNARLKRKIALACLKESDDIKSFKHNVDSYVDLNIFYPLARDFQLEKILYIVASLVAGDGDASVDELAVPINHASLNSRASVVSHSNPPYFSLDKLESDPAYSNHTSIATMQYSIPKHSDPRNVFVPATDLEDAWILDSDHGSIDIRLETKIKSPFFALFAPKSISDPSPHSNPKLIQVWGQISQRKVLLATHTCKWISDVELIELDKPIRDRFDHISLVVLSNHGNRDFTKIYHFGAYSVDF